jgi:hypothetical protein
LVVDNSPGNSTLENSLVNMESSRRHTRENTYPLYILVFSDPEILISWRNICERCQTGGNPNLVNFPFISFELNSVDNISQTP